MPKLQYNLSDIPDFVEVKSGRYRAKLVTCVKSVSANSGNPMLVWTWKILTGKQKGASIKTWTSLQENAMFGMKQHLMAFGYGPKAVVKTNTDHLIGKVVVLVVGKRTMKRDGKDTEVSSVIGLLPKDAPLVEEADDVEDEDDDEEDEPKRKPKRRAKDEDEDEEDDDDDEDDEDEDDEPPAKKPKKRPVKASIKKRRRVEEDDDDDEDDDDEPF